MLTSPAHAFIHSFTPSSFTHSLSLTHESTSHSSAHSLCPASSPAIRGSPQFKGWVCQLWAPRKQKRRWGEGSQEAGQRGWLTVQVSE